MNEEQIERLLEEMSITRKTFEKAVGQIRWNKINTVIQYCMSFVLLFMLIFGVLYYMDDKQESCERGNDTRMSIQVALDENAYAIGIALAIVTGAPQESFEEYIEVYSQQADSEILQQRKC